MNVMPKHKRNGIPEWMATEKEGWQRKCPQCGKEFRMTTGSVREWGPVVGRTALCSIPCMRAYEQAELLREVRQVLKGRAYQMRKLTLQGMSPNEAARALGNSEETVRCAIENLELHHWQALDWIAAHGEEAAAC